MIIKLIESLELFLFVTNEIYNFLQLTNGSFKRNI